MIEDRISGTTIIFSALRNKLPKKPKTSTNDAPNSAVCSSPSQPTNAARARAMAICQCNGMPINLESALRWLIIYFSFVNGRPAP